MSERLRQLFAEARAGFTRLTQREQLMVIGCVAAVATFIVFIVGLLVSSAISRAELRVKSKTDQLTQVLQLQGEYKARLKERDDKMAELGRSNVRLTALVEDFARQAGVEIGQLKPEDGEPNSDGISESSVDLNVRGLSADRLQKFLELIENSKELVIARRLKVTRPYRKDTVDLELKLVTYKMKAG
ncbi:MAG: type II secretion system protein M [Clostridia bacterium]|nr:type II secretion system protein M [Deltaproteobacteria bacterium]